MIIMLFTDIQNDLLLPPYLLTMALRHFRRINPKGDLIRLRLLKTLLPLSKMLILSMFFAFNLELTIWMYFAI